MHICCICGRPIPNKFQSNNPYPVRPESNDIEDVNGRCCPKCNERYVITCRMLVGSPSDKAYQNTGVTYQQNVEALQAHSAADLDKLFKEHGITPVNERMFDNVRSLLKRKLDRAVGEYTMPNFPTMGFVESEWVAKLIKIVSKYYAEFLNGTTHTDETWKSFISNREVMTKMLTDDGNLIYALPDEIKGDKELALLAMKADQGIYKYIAPELQIDMEVALAALTQTENVINPVLIIDYPDDITNNPEFMATYEKLKAEHKVVGVKYD